MIQQQTIIKITDNSGAKTAKCIKVLSGFKKRYAYLGDLIVVSIQKLRNKTKSKSKVTKGNVMKALIVRTKTKHKKKDGSTIYMGENSAVLLNKQSNPIATRLLGPVSKSLRKKKFVKLISIASGLV